MATLFGWLWCVSLSTSTMYKIITCHIEGKEVMKEDFTPFTRAASCSAYKKPSSERESLKLRSSEHSLTLISAAAKRGDKICSQIQKLVRYMYILQIDHVHKIIIWLCSLLLQIGRLHVSIGTDMYMYLCVRATWHSNDKLSAQSGSLNENANFG